MSTEAGVVLRNADQPGDLGWMVMAHGEIYSDQFGWNSDFEVLVARIVADYAEHHNAVAEAAWIVEVEGERAGCIMCVASGSTGVAKLRTLLVTPNGRGRGIGRTLVAQCMSFAKAAGYQQVALWTTDTLVGARKGLLHE